MEPVHHPPHKKRTKLIVFGIFLIILLVLIFSATNDGGKMTGNVIVNGFKINTALNIPKLELNGKFNEIQFEGGSDSLGVSGEKFDLSGSQNNFIIIKEYNGKINFDSDVLALNGKAQKISINGVPLLPHSTDSLNIILDNFNYRYLKINDGVFIDRIEYNATGDIDVEGSTNLKLDNDFIILENFLGELNIENKKINLKGDVERINTRGDTQVSVSK